MGDQLCEYSHRIMAYVENHLMESFGVVYKEEAFLMSSEPIEKLLPGGCLEMLEEFGSFGGYSMGRRFSGP